MHGKVLRFETDDLWDEAMENGMKKGRTEGEYFKLFSLIRIKLSKHKSPRTIAEELEENIEFVEEVIRILNEDNLITDEELYHKIKPLIP
ncbi:MAG: hypothetical protein IJA27_08855 [Lachnospiraceae bacterium]|nr:hypothetical protein [Lachnospiraceae bacterium]